MAQSIQIVLDDTEFQELQKIADRQQMPVADWVRQALGLVRPRRPSTMDRKLEAVHAAARHSFPTGDIDQMLAEIERGCETSTIMRESSALLPRQARRRLHATGWIRSLSRPR